MNRVILLLSCLSITALAEKPELPKILWQGPGQVEAKDIANGIGGPDGAPAPPFTFIEEEKSGTTPKIKVKDAKGTSWSVKFGEEAIPECVSSRLAWMVGYFVESTYCLAEGTIQGVHGLSRTRSFVHQDGSFTRGRFELRAKEPEFKSLMDWGWKNNPFLGTPELHGLKIMMLLTSNWDNKDERDHYDAGSNHGVFERHTEPRAFFYAVTDWGASLGRWGNVATRSKYDCIGYTEQSRDFIEGVHKGQVRWGYHGKHTEDATHDISISDVRWLMKYLGQITDEQLKAGLLANAATPVEADCFQRAIRMRIERLRSIAGSPDEGASPAEAKPSDK